MRCSAQESQTKNHISFKESRTTFYDIIFGSQEENFTIQVFESLKLIEARRKSSGEPQVDVLVSEIEKCDVTFFAQLDAH